MNPLIWLALPIVITALAAVILVRRERAVAPDEREQLSRMARALGHHE